ncbi:MAG: GPW/gp25 family protein [Bacteroidota bacterium]
MWNEETGTQAGELTYPFLGRGWSFPPEFDKINRGLELTAGALDIENSLRLLMGTHPGERKMFPEYGVDLTDLMFESLTLGLQTRIKDIIERAVLRFEPRVLLDEVIFELKSWEGILYLHLYYTIRATNSRTNLVFPYYLLEATDI